MIHDGETTLSHDPLSSFLAANDAATGPVADSFAAGMLLGLLVGEGHFGGDGRQPQVTLRMHVRHEPLFRWLLEKFPGSKLYGPYNHGGRQYYQWMVRGEALKNFLIPLLDTLPLAQLDPHTYERYQHMKDRYKIKLESSSREFTSGKPPPSNPA
ncbi:MAG TPA: hypothetical protein VGX03_31860 [Candidatus Binatia bacterium]|nr:hypothetical protein [Candidatus Binatia bacterium]